MGGLSGFALEVGDSLMLTAAQREKCRQTAEALDRGERVSLDGFSPAERGLIWNERSHVKAMHERFTRRSLRECAAATVASDHVSARPERMALASAETDLDYWPPVASDEPDDDDDDLTPEQETKLCPVCRGLGRDSSGKQCANCDGSGRVPIGPYDDGDDDADEDDED
jgi:hypothetical protein